VTVLHLEYHKNEGGWEVGIVVGLKAQSDPIISFVCFLFLFAKEKL
jgi:hypothetical protein